MNEWSPGGNYSRPGTPNHTGRSFRSQRDEPENGTKPLIVNIRAVADNRSRSFQQHSMEDISKLSLSNGIKNKKVGNGVSDPRFKRVITSGIQNDACVGTEVKSTVISQEKEYEQSKFPVWNSTDLRPNQLREKTLENKELLEVNSTALGGELREYESGPRNKTSNLEQSQDSLKEVEKLTFSHDIIVKSFSKDSLSDCTVNTRNMSLASEDLVDEFSNDLSMFPSATRVKKVQNWIQDQNTKLDKRQSVITVIGQMQGQDRLSSALREINKRRKLVKELDKYAVCKKILESDKDKEISDLVEKINCLSNDGKLVFTESKSKETLNDINSLCTKGSGDKIDKHAEPSENSQGENILSDDHDGNFHIASPISSTQKRASSKKKSKKCHVVGECLVKGKFRDFFSHMQFQWIFCVMVILSGALCWVTFFSISKGTYVSFDLFSSKPKPMTWYEKLCYWIWEIFRPSSNYRRTAPWPPY